MRSGLRGFFVAGLVAGLIAAVAGPAGAAGDVGGIEASARALVAKGEFIAAARAYSRLYAETGETRYLYNEALARQKGGQHAVALDRWQLYQAVERPTGAEARKVAASIAYLQPHVLPIVFDREPGDAVGEWQVQAVPVSDATGAIVKASRDDRIDVPLHQGRWHVDATMAGRTTWTREIDVFVGAADVHVVHLEEPAVAARTQPSRQGAGPGQGPGGEPRAPAGASAGAPPAMGDTATRATVAERDAPGRGLGAGYWAGIGVSGAAAVVGLGLTIDCRLDDRVTIGSDEYETPSRVADYEKYDRRFLAGHGLLGAGLGGLAVSLTGLAPADDRHLWLFSELGVGAAFVVAGGVMTHFGDEDVRAASGVLPLELRSARYFDGLTLRRWGVSGLGLGGAMVLGATLALAFDTDTPLHARLVPLDERGGTMLVFGGGF
jgi:hypothetical protein